jgi:hypothetical protein
VIIKADNHLETKTKDGEAIIMIPGEDQIIITLIIKMHWEKTINNLTLGEVVMIITIINLMLGEYLTNKKTNKEVVIINSPILGEIITKHNLVGEIIKNKQHHHGVMIIINQIIHGETKNLVLMDKQRMNLEMLGDNQNQILVMHGEILKITRIIIVGAKIPRIIILIINGNLIVQAQHKLIGEQINKIPKDQENKMYVLTVMKV